MNAPVNNKTHYRKAFNSPYLSSADITEPTILTISHVRLEQDKTKRTKDYLNTAYFVEREIRKGEPLKPMILNATNSHFLATVANSKYLEDWSNIPVTIWVDEKVRFGRDTVEGLRLARVTQAQGKQDYSTKPPIPKDAFEKACSAVSNGSYTVEQITSKYQLSDSQLSHLESLLGG